MILAPLVPELTVDHRVARFDRRGGGSSTRATVFDPRQDLVDVLDRLGQVRVPSLVVVGDEDLVAERHVASYVASHLPAVTFVLVEGAGHLPSVGRPQEVAVAVRRWLAAYGL